MRCLLCLLLVVALWPLSGCETAWGGSPESSIGKLNAEQNAKVDSMEQDGEITKQQANEMREANSERNTAIGDSVKDSQESAPNPAGVQYLAE